ncbi:MAG: phosphatase PAP2 family protein, partial [Gemmatimonadota bacterium]|nr:phosphatase PAP2 family protein [Gemmatimonadota bacterium]
PPSDSPRPGGWLHPLTASVFAALCLAGAVPPTFAQEAPGGEDGEVWERVGGGLFVLGTLAMLDEPVRDLADGLEGGALDDAAAFGRWYGDWPSTAPFLAGGLLLTGLVADGGEGARRAGAAIAGVLSGSFANEALNRAFGRSRPGEDRGAWQFDPFGGHASLGSGHAAYTFALAAAVDEIADGWVSTPFYVAATVTGLSRIYHDRHWLSDVAVGAAIGSLVGRRATRLSARALGVGRPESPGRSSRRPVATGARLEPVATGRFLGLRIVF